MFCSDEEGESCSMRPDGELKNSIWQETLSICTGKNDLLLSRCTVFCTRRCCFIRLPLRKALRLCKVLLKMPVIWVNIIKKRIVSDGGVQLCQACSALTGQARRQAYFLWCISYVCQPCSSVIWKVFSATTLARLFPSATTSGIDPAVACNKVSWGDSSKAALCHSSQFHRKRNITSLFKKRDRLTELYFLEKYQNRYLNNVFVITRRPQGNK